MHTGGHGGRAEQSANGLVSNQEVLQVQLEEYDNPEPQVAEGTGEDVVLGLDCGDLGCLLEATLLNALLHRHGVKNTAVNHVEEVHDDEAVEHEGLVDHARAVNTVLNKLSRVEVVGSVRGGGSSVHKDKHNDDHVDGLGKDSTHHGFGDDFVVGSDAFLADVLGVGVLGGEGNGGKHIHDEVDPKQLHDGEGAVSDDCGRGDHEEAARDVDSKLELNELADIVLKVTAPSDGGEHSEEVVLGQDDIGVILGGGAAVLTHGEANVSLAKSTGITETLAGNTNGGLGLTESGNKHVLEVGGGSVDQNDVLLEVVSEVFLGFGSLEDPGLATAFFLILFLHHETLELIIDNFTIVATGIVLHAAG